MGYDALQNFMKNHGNSDTKFVNFPQPIPSDNKALARTQLAVLRHVTTLLGYNPSDKNFFVTPTRLRASAIFNSFLSNLPQVLDQNFTVGKTLIPISLNLLHYCPAPNRIAGQRLHPYFSLWLIEKHVRRYWLSALIVILYKVRLNFKKRKWLREMR